MTRTTAKRVNILGADMVELHVSDRYVGSFTNIISYQEAQEAYDNQLALFDWNPIFTYKVLKPLFEK